MGFGAGTLVSAVGYQLVSEASFEHGCGVGISFAFVALTYYVADRIVDRQGGETSRPSTCNKTPAPRGRCSSAPCSRGSPSRLRSGGETTRPRALARP